MVNSLLVVSFALRFNQCSLHLERNVSTYSHSVQCTSTGFYQGFYRRAGSDVCLYSCYFVVSEVRETRLDVLREELSIYRECFIASFIPQQYSSENDIYSK